MMLLVHLFFRKLRLKYKKHKMEKCKIVTSLLEVLSNLICIFFGCLFARSLSKNDNTLILCDYGLFKQFQAVKILYVHINRKRVCVFHSL